MMLENLSAHSMEPCMSWRHMFATDLHMPYARALLDLTGIALL